MSSSRILQICCVLLCVVSVTGYFELLQRGNLDLWSHPARLARVDPWIHHFHHLQRVSFLTVENSWNMLKHVETCWEFRGIETVASFDLFWHKVHFCHSENKLEQGLGSHGLAEAGSCFGSVEARALTLPHKRQYRTKHIDFHNLPHLAALVGVYVYIKIVVSYNI